MEDDVLTNDDAKLQLPFPGHERENAPQSRRITLAIVVSSFPANRPHRHTLPPTPDCHRIQALRKTSKASLLLSLCSSNPCNPVLVGVSLYSSQLPRTFVALPYHIFAPGGPTSGRTAGGPFYGSADQPASDALDLWEQPSLTRNRFRPSSTWLVLSMVHNIPLIEIVSQALFPLERGGLWNLGWISSHPFAALLFSTRCHCGRRQNRMRPQSGLLQQ